MSLNEYISRLESDMRSWGYLSTLGSRKQMPLDDSLWQRLQLARNILGNIETTRNFRGSSLNRSTEEMDKLGDPTWQRLMRELREEALNTSL
ncbi:hypothetical protein HYW99_00565, partial [Candidatus Woesearchaeota archaeon]|nr:hypothetical protein [Candidatus Woesearchaeota archaeon]